MAAGGRILCAHSGDGEAAPHHSREEFDEHDTPDTKYIVVLDDDFPVATCRLYELPEETEGEGAPVRPMMFGRIVVLPEYRKQGLGRLVVTEAEKWARELGCRKAVLDSRDVGGRFLMKSWAIRQITAGS